MTQTSTSTESRSEQPRTTASATTPAPAPAPAPGGGPDVDQLVAARREKLRRWREDLGAQPYGHRVDDITSLADALALYDEAADDAFAKAQEQAAGDDAALDAITDGRPRATVAGRCVQHRAMGKLVFIVLRDASGDMQISISKAAVDQQSFKLASKLDYGDIVVAAGPVGKTRKGEICIWADRFEVHCKSLVPPPEKFHGLTDAELRYRQRYMDMYANPETIRTFQLRSQLVLEMRRFMDSRDYLEVETPMMQPLAGGAAARPFATHHNALDLPLFLRIAPELYLKRLLVGGMPRVYEINRNFRNEGVDRSHNPEFTAMEVYQAFGDCWTMLELTESLLHDLAQYVARTQQAGPDERREKGPDGERSPDQAQSASNSAQGPILPYGDLTMDWSRPFDRISYGDLFQRELGFDMTDEPAVRAKAQAMHIDNAETLDHWLLVNTVYEACCEDAIDPARPTFVTDYPAAISPLTRPIEDKPYLCNRWELLAGGMELGTAYTELNDPDVQLAKFTEQLAGADDEEQAFRALDEDFVHALRVGMPPAGGLGLGVDRIIMLMTNQQSIRDVILFPLMKPEG